jgi:SAM-dependent methyltransferase
MALHPLATGFDDVADAYERGRPGYVPAVVGALAAELGVVAGDPVLDLAAGTGKLTRALVAFGLDVVAVEPQPQLREALGMRVGGERVRDGLAEAIPLPDGAVAAVTVADAFHWFDHARALAEIRRVLRPDGGLAVLTTFPEWDLPWAHEVGELLSGLRPAHPGHDGPSWQESVRAAGDWSAPREILVRAMQPCSRAQVVDYISSISWIAALPPEQRAETLAQVDAIVAAGGGTPAELPIQVTVGLTTPV